MTDDQQLLEVFDNRVERRTERREFFRKFAGASCVFVMRAVVGLRKPEVFSVR